MSSKYPSQVFWSDEDEGFIAVAPDLPGCSAFGETREEAAAELDTAIGAWIEAAQAAGNPVPPPTVYDPNNYSGKVLLRMPKSLHRQVAERARDEGVSLNQYLVYLLSMNQDPAAPGKPKNNVLDPRPAQRDQLPKAVQ